MDTNVIVSALLGSDSVPAAILDLVLQKKVRASVSRAVLEELEQVLRRPKFDFGPRKIGSFLVLLKSRTHLVSPHKTVDICREDPSDNRLLECAEAARAEFLITGNKSHFPSRYASARVVNPREFWDSYLLHSGPR